MFGEPAGDAGSFGKDQFDGMDVTVGSEKIVEAGKNAEGRRSVDVVQEAVEEDEIVGASGDGLGSGDVGDEKIALIAIAGELDIAVVYVDAEVFGVSETGSVGAGAAADVEDTADLAEVIVLQDAGEFLRGEWELRELEEKRLLEEVVESVHGRKSVSPRIG